VVVYSTNGLNMVNSSHLTKGEESIDQERFNDTGVGEIPIIQVSFADRLAFFEAFYTTIKLREVYGGCIFRNT
jgi:hypothetical protein